MIFGALARRYRNATAGKNGDVVIFDRGVSMFEAVAVAVIAMKNEDEDLVNARGVLDGILDKHGLRLPPENLAILMTHGNTVEESVRITMSREDNPDDERYNRYQRLLQSELQRQELRGTYQNTVHIAVTDNIRCVQDQLREILLEKTGNSLFQPTMHHLVGIYAFGGLSECGKSTIAEAYCANFGSRRAFRSKIAYFYNTISEALGLSVYGTSEKEQALHLFHELERFQRSHYWLRLLTIESLHRDSVTKYLKLWLDEKFQVVFIDTSESQRRERSLVPLEQLTGNDETKLQRGAMNIRSYADLVLDNNGPLSKSVSRLLSFSERRGLVPEHASGSGTIAVKDEEEVNNTGDNVKVSGVLVVD